MDYEGFVEKFKPKKTTDDCYTPPPVYEAVKKWVNDNIMPLDGVEIIRPFYPGADFEHAEYPEGCVVIDNPPFSILAKIRRFYHSRGIKYFLFSPSLTMANSAKELAPETCYIITHADITYENGAVVRTSFLTNLDCAGTAVWIAGDLYKIVTEASDQYINANKKPAQPCYVYPLNVMTPALMGKVVNKGVSMRIPHEEVEPISKLDCQGGKAIFGGGWLISERAAAERAAAKRITYWELSDRERAIVARLSGKNNNET